MVNIYELLRRNQDGTSDYIRTFLDGLGVTYNVDNYGNIYFLDYENCPLLSAHMDTIRDEDDFCISAFLTEDDNEKIVSGGILGGDDKCGVYIILKAIEAGKKVNFIFSRDEEIGCLGIKALASSEEICEKIKNCLWCLVLDRRGNSDIICYNNNYGTKEFEGALEKISKDFGFGYSPKTGLCSDANTIRNYISTANISTGYFSPHSKNEYIVKADLKKACDYTFAIIDSLKDKFAPLEQKYTKYYDDYDMDAYYNYNDYDYGYSYYGNQYPYYDYNAPVSKHLYKMDYTKEESDKEKRLCHFCDIHAYEDEELYEIELPDGNRFNICECCLNDLENEIKRIRMSTP